MGKSAEGDAEGNFSAEEVLPVEVIEPAVPIPLHELMPWHRPRKQQIREMQWSLRADRLLNHLTARKFGQHHEFAVHYLTLAGMDYLDVRVLADTCDKHNATLSSTSLLAEEEGNPVMARARMREASLVEAGHISDRSTTLPYRLEDVAHANSQAYREVAQRAPYQIINIDACGSMALPRQDGQGARILDAVHRLVELQLDRSSDRWLLFVTTDARPDSLSGEVLAAFKRAIISNAAHNDNFKQAAFDHFGVSSELDPALDEASNGGEKFLSLVSLGLSKWLLHNAQDKGWYVKAHDAYCYATGTGMPTMASLAFEFIPPPAGLLDKYGAVNISPLAGGGTEDYSIRALNKCINIENLDDRLANDNELAERLTVATRSLLRDAGYPDEIVNQLS